MVEEAVSLQRLSILLDERGRLACLKTMDAQLCIHDLGSQKTRHVYPSDKTRGESAVSLESESMQENCTYLSERVVG